MPVILALWDAEAGRLLWAQEFKTNLGNLRKPYLYKKYKNQPGMAAHTCNPSYSGGWGRRILEAEVAVSWDVPLHSSLSNKSETPTQKKKEQIFLI